MKKLIVKFATYSLVVALPLFTMNSCTKDPCNDVTCENSGVATESGDDCLCVCTDSFEGDKCQTEARQKFISNYNWTDQCSPGISYTARIEASATGVNKVTITNILGELEGTAIATISKNNITIESQTVNDVDGDAWTVKSTNTGELSNNSFTLTIQATFGTTTITCTYNFTKS